MSLITGYLKQLVGTPGNDQVTIRAAVYPVVVGGALILPETKVVRANDLGFWQCFVVQGYYDISVLAANGQTAKVTINVPNDSLTYSFDQLIVSSLPVLSPPTNGVVPTASPSQLGLAKVDTVDADPVAVLGFFYKATHAAVRSAITNKASNKMVYITGTGETYDWDPASVATDEDNWVLKLADTGGGTPGRFVKRPEAFTRVATGAAMKAIPSSARVKLVCITNRESMDYATFYNFVSGDVTAADGSLIVAPTDGGGRYFALSI